jgi:hypothetical protein
MNNFQNDKGNEIKNIDNYLLSRKLLSEHQILTHKINKIYEQYKVSIFTKNN